ncbi:MAG: hypothetical protein WB662_19240, partial [Methyloceanibacter sp.]
MMLLHMILLPVNVVRLAQIYQLGRSVAHSDGEGLSIQNLRPFMTRRDLPARTTLITKGEWADKLYYLMEGQLEIVELGKTLGCRRGNRRNRGGCSGSPAHRDRCCLFDRLCGLR